MNTKSLKRVTRVAAVLSVPVAAAMIVTAGPATAVSAGELLVTTTIDYDYAVIDNTDDDGNGFVAGVNGSIPVFSNDPEAATETNIYATYTQPTYSLGYTYNVEDNLSTVTAEVYPADNVTVGITADSSGDASVYAGYDDGTVAFGGAYDLKTGETTVNASYTTDQYSVGGEANLTTGEASVYGEIYPDANTTLGVTASNDGSSSLYGSHTTDINDNVSVTTSFEYGLTNAKDSQAPETP
ncbi:hypothetical protein [Smaragdicoccus niigatensis]|uniref:hypothetical protein n=1 Tax=Smaragdicoccus niigatensis TaxID=359359 RepID=UPI00035CF260|nr:hypothetical protein [Smaragdicoccus niigatensis]